VGSFWTALKFLTIFPWPRGVGGVAGEIGRSSPFFPLVGFFLGLILVFLSRLLESYLATEILSVVLVTSLLWMTRALHLAGLQRTFDRLGEEEKVADAFEAVAKSHVGILGLLATLGVLAFKFRAIEVMGEASTQGLLLAPVLGRWSMVSLVFGSDWNHEERDAISLERVSGWHLFFATLLALALVVVVSDRLGLWIALWISLFTLLSRAYLHRRLAGIGLSSLGAVGEISEALALVLFATL